MYGTAQSEIADYNDGTTSRDSFNPRYPVYNFDRHPTIPGKV